MSYRRALEEEKRLKESVLANENQDEKETEAQENVKNEHENGNDSKNDETAANADANEGSIDKTNVPPCKKLKLFGAFTNAKIETVNENLKEQSLTVQQINDYCKSLFIFKNIRVMRFS